MDGLALWDVPVSDHPQAVMLLTVASRVPVLCNRQDKMRWFLGTTHSVEFSKVQVRVVLGDRVYPRRGAHCRQIF